jgi:hypothetical protein
MENRTALASARWLNDSEVRVQKLRVMYYWNAGQLSTNHIFWKIGAFFPRGLEFEVTLLGFTKYYK